MMNDVCCFNFDDKIIKNLIDLVIVTFGMNSFSCQFSCCFEHFILISENFTDFMIMTM